MIQWKSLWAPQSQQVVLYREVVGDFREWAKVFHATIPTLIVL
jgi:hypothetical protein